ncbi:hypothetical protein LWH94_19020, partial [Marinobacter sp. G11]|nr:hypothetical protein [Marinobacter sp. G11]
MSIHSTDLLECIDLRNQAGEEEGRFPRRWYKPVTAVIHSQNGDKRVMKKYPNGVFPLSLYFRMLANHEYRMLIRADGAAFTPSLASRCSVSVHSETSCHPTEFRSTVTSDFLIRGCSHEKTPHSGTVAGP